MIYKAQLENISKIFTKYDKIKMRSKFRKEVKK